MALARYGFLIKATGYHPDRDRARIDCASFASSIVCVSDMEQAIDAAQHLIGAGVQLIELCGGFNAQEAAELSDALGGVVPIGHVTFSPREQVRLDKVLGG